MTMISEDLLHVVYGTMAAIKTNYRYTKRANCDITKTKLLGNDKENLSQKNFETDSKTLFKKLTSFATIVILNRNINMFLD
jgi:hypothetical protein